MTGRGYPRLTKRKNSACWRPARPCRPWPTSGGRCGRELTRQLHVFLQLRDGVTAQDHGANGIVGGHRNCHHAWSDHHAGSHRLCALPERVPHSISSYCSPIGLSDNHARTEILHDRGGNPTINGTELAESVPTTLRVRLRCSGYRFIRAEVRMRSQICPWTEIPVENSPAVQQPGRSRESRR